MRRKRSCRFISSLLMACVIFTMLFADCGIASANTSRGKAKEIKYVYPSSVVYEENTNGQWSLDNNGDFYYRYKLTGPEVFIVEYENGEEVTYSGGVGVGDPYYSILEYKGSDGTRTVLYNNCVKSSQDQKHFESGGDNYFTFTFNGASVKIPVEITKSTKEKTVETIHYIPAIEELDYSKCISVYNGEKDEMQLYFYYYNDKKDGDQLVITDKGGDKKVYTYQKGKEIIAGEDTIWEDGKFVADDGNEISPDSVSHSDDQDLYEWGHGKDCYFLVEYGGAVTKVPIKITTDDVASISIYVEEDSEPCEIPCDQNGAEYGELGSLSFVDGIVVHKIDGSEEILKPGKKWITKEEYDKGNYDGYDYYEKGFLNEKNELKNVQIMHSSVKNSGQWYAYYHGVSCEIPTAHYNTSWEVKEKPTCSKAGVYERVCTCGEVVETKELPIDKNAHKFTKYVYNNDAKVGIDGTETAVCDNGCSATDTRIKAGSALESGSSGNDDTSEITSIRLALPKAVELIKESGGFWRTDESREKYYYYNVYQKVFMEGSVLTVTNKDSSSITYTYGWKEGSGEGFFSADGKQLPMADGDMDGVRINDTQYDVHWTVGNTYNVEIEYMGQTTTVPVKIVENPVQSIQLKVPKEIELIAESGGFWRTDESGKKYYEYNVYQKVFTEGSVLTVTNKDGSSTAYTYGWKEGSGRIFTSADGKEIAISGSDGVRINDTQYEAHWTVGKTYNAEIEYMGKTTTVPVKIIENPVQSIQLKVPREIELIAEANGNWQMDRNGEKYYWYNAYQKIFTEGSVLTVKNKDGSSTPYTYGWKEGSGEGFFSADGKQFLMAGGDMDGVRINDTQYNDHWTVGKSHNVEIEYMGKTTTVPVKIVENPVRSIQLKVPREIELIAEANGNWQTDRNGEKYYWYNAYQKVFTEGSVLTVTNKDGSSTPYTYGWKEGSGRIFTSADGKEIAISGSDGVRINDTQYEAHWTVGKTYNVEIEYMGKTTTVPVKIIENPVQSIQLKVPREIELIAEANGNWQTDRNGEKYYWYNAYQKVFTEGSVLTVKNKDGSSTPYTYGWKEGSGEGFFSADGKQFLMAGGDMDGVRINDTQYNNHWTVGKSHNVEIEYMGKTATVPVKIVENPVQAIEFTVPKEVEIFAGVGGSWQTDRNGKKYYHYYFDHDYSYWNKIFAEGSILTVTNTDRTRTVYTCGWKEDVGRIFTSADGKEIAIWGSDGVRINDTQYETHWTVGNTYNVEIEYMGKTTTVPIKIIENPVQSIQLKVPKKIELIAEANGYWQTDRNGEKYYWYNAYQKVFTEGSVLTVINKDGSSTPYTYGWKEGSGEGFFSVTGEEILVEGDEVWINNTQYIDHWVVGNTYNAEIEYMGKTTTVSVKIVENPVQSIQLKTPEKIELVKGEWDFEETFFSGCTLTVTNVDGSSTTYTYKKSGEAAGFFSEDGKELPEADTYLWIMLGEEDLLQWTTGNTYDVEVQYMGRSTTIQVSYVRSSGESSGGGGGVLPPAPTEPTVQEPTISTGDGYTVNLGKDGTTATITVKDGYEIEDVLVNGISKGKVTSLTGLKTGDKVEVRVAKKEESPTVEEVKSNLSKVTKRDFKARSAQVKMKNGKTAIKVVWDNTSGVKFDGVEIFRSVKKYSGFGTKPIFTTKKSVYYNTAIKEGTTYYYKVRGYIVVDGIKYYTDWSTKAYRAIK